MPFSSFDPSSAGATVVAPTRPRVSGPARTRRERSTPPPPPPVDRGDGGGDGGGGEHGDGPPPVPDRPPPGAASFALGLAMIGISTLFLVLLAVWLLLRRNAPDPARSASFIPPNALWISTFVLLASSATVERAARIARGIRPVAGAVLRWLSWSLVLGFSFLGAQGYLWWSLIDLGLVPSSGAYGATFYALTGLHAVHVLGGLATMGGSMMRVGRDSGPFRRAGAIRLCATYWHFMGVVWLVLFATLYFLR